MKIKINSEYLHDKYSKYANEEFRYKDQPVVSFPFEIKDIPEEVNYLCFTLIDHDAIPVCGFSWIHWSVANIPSANNNIIEDFSRSLDDETILQGKNSFASFFVGETDTNIIQKYVGPTPPDKEHNYTLTVYGLAKPVNLENGFFLNELCKEMNGKIICETTINLKAKS